MNGYQYTVRLEMYETNIFIPAIIFHEHAFKSQTLNVSSVPPPICLEYIKDMEQNPLKAVWDA